MNHNKNNTGYLYIDIISCENLFDRFANRWLEIMEHIVTR